MLAPEEEGGAGTHRSSQISVCSTKSRFSAWRKMSPVPNGARIEKPVGIANFPIDLIPFPPRSMVERKYRVTPASAPAVASALDRLELPAGAPVLAATGP